MPWIAPVVALATVGAGVYSAVSAADNVDTLARIEEQKMQLQKQLGEEGYKIAQQQIDASVKETEKLYDAQAQANLAKSQQAQSYASVLPVLALIGGAILIMKKK